MNFLALNLLKLLDEIDEFPLGEMENLSYLLLSVPQKTFYNGSIQTQK